ncbi:hypothetical protein, partial [Ligilactobacillus equi]
MQSTTQFDLKNLNLQQVGAVEKHMDHEPNVNHRNKTINFAMSKYNTHVMPGDINQLLNAIYMPEIEARDLKMRKQVESDDSKLTEKQYNEMRVNGPRDYLKKKTPAVGVVLGVGSSETTQEMLSDLGIEYGFESVTDENGASYKRIKFMRDEDAELWSDLNREACMHALNEFSQRAGFEVVKASFHADEIPQHMHIVALKHGEKRKKTGKVSTSLNSCVKKFLGNDAVDNNRKNLKTMNRLVADSLIDGFNLALAKKGITQHVDLERLRAKGGLDMDARKALNAENERLAGIQKDLVQRKKQLEEEEATFEAYKRWWEEQ